MKRPLAGVLVGYAGGVLLGHFFTPSPTVLWSLALASGLLALTFRQWQQWLIWPLLIFAGWANLVTQVSAISPDDLRRLLDQNPAQVTLRGILATPPQLKISERKKDGTEHSLTELEVTGMRRSTKWESAVGRVMITAPDVPDARFFKGQLVEVGGVIAPPAPPLAPGLMDYPEYLRNKDIYFVIKTKSANDWQLAPGASTSLPSTQRFLNWAKQTLALGMPQIDEPLQLIWAMALGWRTPFTGEVSDPYLKAGTMHLFAVDGLRIGLVSAMFLTLLRALRLSRAVCGFICIPAAWFYTAATGWEPSAIRASVMITIVMAGWALKRPGDLINSLYAAALIILACDPVEMFQAGFQLSFLVVLVIARMLPPMNDWIKARCRFNPLVPEATIPEWRKGEMKVVRRTLQFAALSLAAWVGSIPLSAKYFHLFSPVSTLANVVAVPLGMLTLTSIMGSLLCGAWLPWCAGLFNNSAWLFMWLLNQVSDYATRLPGAYYYVPEPSWVTIAVYYVVLVVGLASSRVRKLKFGPLAVLAGLAVAVGVWLWNAEGGPWEPRLTVLPLSGSQVVFVDGRDGNARLLINCGNDSAVDSTLKPWLRAQGINYLPRFVLTTGSEGDSGGATRLAQLFPMGSLYTSTNHFRSPGYREFVAQFDHPRSIRQNLRLNDMVAGWQVLHPGPADNWPRGDDNALVLRGRLGHATVLLLADLGRDGQSSLLGRTNDLRADIIVASVPARGEPLCDDLIHAVHPRLIVMVEPDFPSSPRAESALKRRLGATGIPVIYTRAAGAVTITAHRESWEASAMDGQDFRFDNAGD